MTLGAPVDGWTPRPPVEPFSATGHFARVEKLDAARHGPAMFAAHREGDPDGALWTYLPYGPFASLDAYQTHLHNQEGSRDPLFFAILDAASGDAVGVASLMRQDPANGVVEIGHICYTPRLVRTPAATEAMFLLMRHVFDDLGYRRYEWKCNAGNAASKRAAERLGFVEEGVFRQHMVIKGRNRDTAWFSILDGEWPVQKERFLRWLDPDNFDAGGRQKTSLSA